MYEALTLLPPTLFNQTFEAYIAEHIFSPLNMTHTTYSVAEAEAGALAHGHQRHLRDFYAGQPGVLRPTVPYFQRPGEERVWAGAGGVLSSPRDLVRSPLVPPPIPANRRDRQNG